jgi:hypothetical protein
MDEREFGTNAVALIRAHTNCTLHQHVAMQLLTVSHFPHSGNSAVAATNAFAKCNHSNLRQTPPHRVHLMICSCLASLMQPVLKVLKPFSTPERTR